MDWDVWEQLQGAVGREEEKLGILFNVPQNIFHLHKLKICCFSAFLRCKYLTFNVIIIIIFNKIVYIFIALYCCSDDVTNARCEINKSFVLFN